MLQGGFVATKWKGSSAITVLTVAIDGVTTCRLCRKGMQQAGSGKGARLQEDTTR